MEIQDYELKNISNGYENIVAQYSSGNLEVDTTKNYLVEFQREINNKINYQESKLKGLKNPTDIHKSNAIILATSKDIGLVESSMNEALSKNNYSFVFYLSDLVSNSRSYSDVEKYKVKRINEQAEIHSGYAKQFDILEQARVIRAEVESAIENIGTVDKAGLRSKTNMARSSAEIGYVRDKEKRERIAQPS